MKKVRVLIVEDEAILAQDIREALEETGYDISDIAHTGEDAVRSVKVNPPDIIIIDINLRTEGIDGIETMILVNQLVDIPLVFLTASTDNVNLSRAKTVNPHAYLTKPFDHRELAIAMELALHNFEIGTNSEKRNSLQDDQSLVLSTNMFIKANGQYAKVPFDDLLYVEADGSYSTVVTNQRMYKLAYNLSAFCTKVSLPHIVRVHRSFAVNIRQIDEFGDHSILIGKTTIPVSRNYYKHLKECLIVL